MRITILFFSTLREITGADEITMDFDAKDAITVGDALERLYIVYPKLRDWDEQVLVALDECYVERNASVVHGQELAVMPPVQGG